MTGPIPFELCPRRPRQAGRVGGLMLVLAALAAFVAPGLRAQSAYRNPVLARPQGVADPFILKWNGEYYLYATGDPIMAYHSRDLVHWDEIGPVLSSSKAPNAWNQADVWAPEVVYRNGSFYLYYTASKASPDWRVGEYARRVGVAVSESPRGPFVDSGHPVTSYWTIDGDVFRDPDSTAAGPAGAEYLFASYLDEARWHGAGITADRLVAPDRAAGAPALVTRGSEAWEDKDGDPNNGSLRYTNEAPTVFKRHGRYYMFYSGGSWDLPTYAMGYAWSDSLPRGGLEGPGWHKVVPPVLRSTPFVDAPGHNTLTKAPNDVDDVTAYHARVVPFVGPGDRQTFVDRVWWNRDRPFLEQPTTATLAPPSAPLFGDIFDRQDGALGERWTVRSGTWRIAAEEARATANALALAPLHARRGEYVLEANVRFMGGRGAGSAGVVAWDPESPHHFDVLLDRGRRALVTTGEAAGRGITEQVSALPADFRFEAWHQLLVTCDAGVVRVALDGVNVQRCDAPCALGSIGLRTIASGAAFDGIAFTPHYDETFDEPVRPGVWSFTGEPWTTQDGALHQLSSGRGLKLALRGMTGTSPTSSGSYEFAASVRLRDSDTTSFRVGIVAARDSQSAVWAGFDHDIWPFARFHVWYWGRDAHAPQRGFISEPIAVAMPRGFRYDEYHTIRVIRQGSAFTFFLDGQELVAARFPIGSQSVGLFTRGARADFDDVAATQLVTPRNLALDPSFEAERWEPAPGGPELPWRLEGKAQVSQCCGHTGVRRLLLTGSDGRASQVVPWLQPGRYRLEAWVSTRDADGEIVALPGHAAWPATALQRTDTVEEGPIPRATGASEGWRRLTLDFEVPQGYNAATIVLSGTLATPGGFVAFDDVYLQKR